MKHVTQAVTQLIHPTEPFSKYENKFSLIRKVVDGKAITLRKLNSVKFENENDIWHAARIGNIVLVKQNVDEGTNVNTLDFYGNNAYYYACLCEHPQLVNFLLDQGGIDFEERGYLCTSNQVRELIDKKKKKNFLLIPQLKHNNNINHQLM